MKKDKTKRGYFGIGVFNPKTHENIGTLWRGAYQLGADFIFTIGKRYSKQHSDTLKTWRHIPLFQFKNFEEFKSSALYDCRMVAIEFGDTSVPIQTFDHPQRAVYILGSEDGGLPKEILRDDNVFKLELPSVRTPSYNVAMAGTLVMYDRFIKGEVAQG